MKESEILASIRERKHDCWIAARMFLNNQDAHGIMDMGAEIQALERAEKEIERLSE